MLDFHTIIFIGPQGSGKGTQAQLLSRRLNSQYLEMGGLLRKISKEDSDFGREIKSQIEKGLLISDSDLIRVIDEKLKDITPETKIIFDGVPRKIGQAEYLINYLKSSGRPNVITIYMRIPRHASIDRLTKRLICSQCEHPEIANGDPAQVCSVCGGKLVRRQDDTPELINKRLDLFEKETLPVVDYLKHATKFFEIDGTGEIVPVEEQIDNALGISRDV